MDYIAITTDNYIEHHGILGQKWGIRRYQNADGSLTDAGKKRQKIKDEDKYDTKDTFKNATKVGAAAGLGVLSKAAIEAAKYTAGAELGTGAATTLSQIPYGVLAAIQTIDSGAIGILEAGSLAGGVASLMALPAASLALGVAGTAGLVGTGAAIVKKYFNRHSYNKDDKDDKK